MGKRTGFGWVRVFGETYNYDVVVYGSRVMRRRKDLSRAYRGEYGHTPLSDVELNYYIREYGVPEVVIIATGVYGELPITPKARELLNNLASKGVKIIIGKTSDSIVEDVEKLSSRRLLAIIHTTC